MDVRPALRQRKFAAEDFAKGGRIVSNDLQSAASFRTIRSECANNYVAARGYEPGDLLRIKNHPSKKSESPVFGRPGARGPAPLDPPVPAPRAREGRGGWSGGLIARARSGGSGASF
jgi:hypothetical protein